MQNCQRIDCISPNRGIEDLRRVVAYHLDAPSDAIPRRGVHSRYVQRREYPNDIVGHEKMWSRGPLLDVPIEALQVAHADVAGNTMPFRELRRSGVVKDHKLRSPGVEADGIYILPKRIDRKTLPDNPFPIAHISSFMSKCAVGLATIRRALIEAEHSLKSVWT